MTTQNDITLLEKADALRLGDRAPETERPVSEGRVCEGCGKSLTGRRPQARFCSDRCRSRVKRDARSNRLAELANRLDETVVALRRELETLR